jgi:DNA-binding GntR family transcriptional regulator
MTDTAPAAAQAAQLSPISGLSRRDAVITEIKRAIVLGRLRPGEKLTEQGLSSMLGVSRPTIREALNQLVMEGLLTQEPYRGMRVADLDAQAVLDIAHIRMAIDLQAVEGILADPTGHRMELLDQAWEAYVRQADAQDPLVQHEAHIALHRDMWKASENVFLQHLWPVVEAHVTIALAHDQVTRHDPGRAFAVHKELIDAIKAGDRERIRRAFTVHTVDSACVLADIMRSQAPTA